MSRMKRYAEKVSEDMGRGGVIDDEVLAEAARRLEAEKMPNPLAKARKGGHIEATMTFERLVRDRADLLASCKELARWMKELADSGDAGFWKAEEQGNYKRAMAAIAKATIDPDDPAVISATAAAIIESGDLEGGAA